MMCLCLVINFFFFFFVKIRLERGRKHDIVELQNYVHKVFDKSPKRDNMAYAKTLIHITCLIANPIIDICYILANLML
jgi:hypothetical protein